MPRFMRIQLTNVLFYTEILLTDCFLPDIATYMITIMIDVLFVNTTVIIMLGCA